MIMLVAPVGHTAGGSAVFRHVTAASCVPCAARAEAMPGLALRIRPAWRIRLLDHEIQPRIGAFAMIVKAFWSAQTKDPS
jgi:hypothetical protein